MQHTLSKLYGTLCQPIAPANVGVWLNNVDAAVGTLAVELIRYVRTSIDPQFARILCEDPCATLQVEAHMRRDQALLDEIARFSDARHELRRRLARCEEPDVIQQAAEGVQRQGLLLIDAIERQTLAVELWLAERPLRAAIAWKTAEESLL